MTSGRAWTTAVRQPRGSAGLRYRRCVVHTSIAAITATWQVGTLAAPWIPRCEHTMAIMGSTVVLAGGSNSGQDKYNDVWWSLDLGGKGLDIVGAATTAHPPTTAASATWLVATLKSPWTDRSGHSMAAVKSTLVIAGGRRGQHSDGGPFDQNDVWLSSDVGGTGLLFLALLSLLTLLLLMSQQRGKSAQLHGPEGPCTQWLQAHSLLSLPGVIAMPATRG